ncbi:MAG TPA: AbgT family transporter [Acidimicrobiales bacterium]|nr:AbgT family transporter [Acidimicrobiales bacterium]
MGATRETEPDPPVRPSEGAAGAATDSDADGKRPFTQRVLDGIERVGNRVPHPAIIFLALCVLVIVLSQVFYLFDAGVTAEIAEPKATAVSEDYVGGSIEPEITEDPNGYLDPDYHIVEERIEVDSLLTGDGIRFIFSSFVDNFANFSVVAVALIAMIGVGVAESAGLMDALIRKLVKVSPPKGITFIIVFIGVLSSVATDAGYLILIPLGAAAFLSIGRHPLAGLAAAYAGVSAGFAVNLLITPIDGLITEITNETIHLVDPARSIDLTANLYFSIGSTFLVAIVATIITEKMIEPRLGAYVPGGGGFALAGAGAGGGTVAVDDVDGVGGIEPAAPESAAHETTAVEAAEPAEVAEAGHDDEPRISPADESRGLRFALYGFLGMAAVVVLLTVLPSAPLRNPETGAIIGDSPFMDSLMFIITLLFLAAGIAFGRGAKSLTTSVEIIEAITRAFAGLSGLLFLLLLISQFIAYFNFSHMPEVAAIKMADFLEARDVGVVWLLVGLIIVVAILDLIIPGVVPKWAIFAPVFVPLFLRLGVAPQTVLAAYRVADSPLNVVTPLMVYLPFIVVVAQRYRKDAGIGTILSLMIPYALILLVVWIVFFVGWYLLGIPLGPGYPVKL